MVVWSKILLERVINYLLIKNVVHHTVPSEQRRVPHSFARLLRKFLLLSFVKWKSTQAHYATEARISVQFIHGAKGDDCSLREAAQYYS